MSETREIQVPDIGDFDSVDVVEVLVKPGDTVTAEQPLITLESEKAALDVPAPFGGTVD
ncbi:MAG: biotin/lipoyl-containing protein, partial [Candidatus Macondimonas sp.]